jgi:hypothetical protein
MLRVVARRLEANGKNIRNFKTTDFTDDTDFGIRDWVLTTACCNVPEGRSDRSLARSAWESVSKITVP